MDKSNLRGNVRLKITGNIAINYKKDHKLLTSKERDFPFVEAKSVASKPVEAKFHSANEIMLKLNAF